MQAVTSWWEPNPDSDTDEADRAGALITETANIEQYQRAWHELNLWNATLYSNRELVGFNWGTLYDAGRELWPTNLHTENLIEEVGDSMLAKASSSPLKPTLTPHGNSWKTERNVKQIDQFQYGVWRQTNSEDAAVRAYLDAFISSIGCVHSEYDEKSKTLRVEPVFFDSVVIDNRECVNRQEPRTYRIRRVLPRAAIEARYGKELGPRTRYADYRQIGDGWEVVVTAWRLPDSDGDGGYHMVASCGKILHQEKWTETWVPLEFYHWKDRLSGFFTQSGVEQLVPYQVRQNELNETISEAQDIACRPRMKIHANSQINLDQWDNKAGRFVMWSGSEPEALVWPTNLTELYQERERNSAKAFSHVGQSEMFAHADVPQQVRFDSSAGLREAQNMEDARHLRSWTNFEHFRLRIAKMNLRVLSKHPGADAYSAVYHPPRSHAAGRRIQFNAIRDLLKDNYSWTMEAASLNQQSPAARRETLRDYVSRGIITDEQAHAMLVNPNLEWQDQLELAGFDDIHRHIDLMEEGGYEPPTEITNLSYGIKKVTANIHRLNNYEDMDPAVVENHIRWLVKAVTITQTATAPAPSVAFAPTQGMPGTSAAMSPHTLIQNGPGFGPG